MENFSFDEKGTLSFYIKKEDLFHRILIENPFDQNELCETVDKAVKFQLKLPNLHTTNLKNGFIITEIFFESNGNLHCFINDRVKEFRFVFSENHLEKYANKEELTNELNKRIEECILAKSYFNQNLIEGWQVTELSWSADGLLSVNIQNEERTHSVVIEQSNNIPLDNFIVTIKNSVKNALPGFLSMS